MQLIFFMGKGGVGKSTLSSMSAFQLANAQRKTLLVSIDPAHNLMDIFSPKKDHEILHLSKNLTIKELDVEKQKHKYIRKTQQEIKQEFKHLASLNLDLLIDTMKYTPGIEEYVILDSFATIVREEKNYDFIIFDTPPTALTLRILTMPLVAEHWTEKLQKIRKQILSGRQALHNIQGAKDFEKTYGEKIKRNSAEDPIFQRLQSIHKQHKALSEIIKNPSTTTIIPVLNPDKLSLKETDRISHYLQNFKIEPSLLVLNKFNDQKKVLNEIKKRYAIPTHTVASKSIDYLSTPEHFNEVKLDFLLSLLNKK